MFFGLNSAQQTFQELTKQAIKSDAAFTNIADDIAQQCAETGIPLKTLKVVVDHVKAVIKSGAKHSSQEKLRALQLLDKCLIKGEDNEQFVKYTQKKMMDRLKIMATHCPKGTSVSDAGSLNQRGASIFMPNEPDTKHASLFLIQLLECLKSWAEKFPKDGGQASTFVRVYTELQSKNVAFPNKDQLQRQHPQTTRQTELAQRPRNQFAAQPSNKRSSSNPGEEQKQRGDPGLQKSSTQANLAAKSQVGSLQAATAATESKPKKFSEQLKTKMQFVRDESKKSEKYLQELEKQNFVVKSIAEHEDFIKNVQLAQSKAEECIEWLMSEQGANKIKNTEELLQKIFDFQEQLRSSCELLTSVPVTVASASAQQSEDQVLAKQPFESAPQLQMAKKDLVAAEPQQQPQQVQAYDQPLQDMVDQQQIPASIQLQQNDLFRTYQQPQSSLNQPAEESKQIISDQNERIDYLMPDEPQDTDTSVSIHVSQNNSKFDMSSSRQTQLNDQSAAASQNFANIDDIFNVPAQPASAEAAFVDQQPPSSNFQQQQQDQLMQVSEWQSQAQPDQQQNHFDFDYSQPQQHQEIADFQQQQVNQADSGWNFGDESQPQNAYQASDQAFQYEWPAAAPNDQKSSELQKNDYEAAAEANFDFQPQHDQPAYEFKNQAEEYDQPEADDGGGLWSKMSSFWGGSQPAEQNQKQYFVEDPEPPQPESQQPSQEAGILGSLFGGFLGNSNEPDQQNPANANDQHEHHEEFGDAYMKSSQQKNESSNLSQKANLNDLLTGRNRSQNNISQQSFELNSGRQASDKAHEPSSFRGNFSHRGEHKVSEEKERVHINGEHGGNPAPAEDFFQFGDNAAGDNNYHYGNQNFEAAIGPAHELDDPFANQQQQQQQEADFFNFAGDGFQQPQNDIAQYAIDHEVDEGNNGQYDLEVQQPGMNDNLWEESDEEDESKRKEWAFHQMTDAESESKSKNNKGWMLSEPDNRDAPSAQAVDVQSEDTGRLQAEIVMRDNTVNELQAQVRDMQAQIERQDQQMMKQSVDVNDYRQQCYGKDDTIKRLNDELRDMENELNMTKLLNNKRNPEDEARINELEITLEQQKMAHQAEIQQVQEKMSQFEKKINNVQNLEMQLESLCSEVKFKTEQSSRLQTEVFEKDIDIQRLTQELENMKKEMSLVNQKNAAQFSSSDPYTVSQPPIAQQLPLNRPAEPFASFQSQPSMVQQLPESKPVEPFASFQAPQASFQSIVGSESVEKPQIDRFFGVKEPINQPAEKASVSGSDFFSQFDFQGDQRPQGNQFSSGSQVGLLKTQESLPLQQESNEQFKSFPGEKAPEEKEKSNLESPVPQQDKLQQIQSQQSKSNVSLQQPSTSPLQQTQQSSASIQQPKQASAEINFQGDQNNFSSISPFQTAPPPPPHHQNFSLSGSQKQPQVAENQRIQNPLNASQSPNIVKPNMMMMGPPPQIRAPIGMGPPPGSSQLMGPPPGSSPLMAPPPSVKIPGRGPPPPGIGAPPVMNIQPNTGPPRPGIGAPPLMNTQFNTGPPPPGIGAPPVMNTQPNTGPPPPGIGAPPVMNNQPKIGPPPHGIGPPPGSIIRPGMGPPPGMGRPMGPPPGFFMTAPPNFQPMQQMTKPPQVSSQQPLQAQESAQQRQVVTQQSITNTDKSVVKNNSAIDDDADPFSFLDAQ